MEDLQSLSRSLVFGRREHPRLMETPLLLDVTSKNSF